MSGDGPDDALRKVRGTSKEARETKPRGIAPHKRKRPSELPLTRAKPRSAADRYHLLEGNDRLTDPRLGEARLTPPSLIDRYHRYIAEPPKEPRILRTGHERRASIIAGSPKADSPVLIPRLGPPPPKASGDKPRREKPEANQVVLYDQIIVRAAEAFGVDPDLIRAIMYMETTHGYYDRPFDYVNLNKTILPMNVHVDYWKGLGFDRQALHDPIKNIIAGTYILKGIMERLDSPTTEEIATLYNSLSSDNITQYGLRVAAIYRSRLWEQK